MSLLAIGTLGYDDVETIHEQRIGLLGGSAVHFAVAAAPYCPVRLVSVVGRDWRAADSRLLEDRGVDLAGLEVAEGKTFRWGGRYEANWNKRHTLFTELNVLETFQPKLPVAYRDSRFVFLANAHPAVQMAGLAQVKQPRFVVADTMNLWINIARPELDTLLKRVDGVILNDEEASMLTGEANLIRAARAVLSLGPRYVILKKGEHGAFIMGQDAHFSLPAYPVTEVVDPTGAGDSFAGGFMGSLARAGEPSVTNLRRAMLHGTVTASFCVEGFSVEGLTGRGLDDYQRRYDELREIVSI